MKRTASTDGCVRRLYLCGPVTGIPGLNRPAFDEAAETLREAGYAVLLPHDAVPAHAGWPDAMRISIAAMLGCDGLALVDGWEGSRGAAMEIEIARRCGMAAFSVGYLAAAGRAENMGRKTDGENAGHASGCEPKTPKHLRERRNTDRWRFMNKRYMKNKRPKPRKTGCGDWSER